MRVGWVVLSQSFSWGCEDVSWGVNHLMFVWGWKVHFQAIGILFFHKADKLISSVNTWGNVSHGPYHTIVLASWWLILPEASNPRDPGRTLKCLYDLALEIRYCHFLIFLITQVSPDRIRGSHRGKTYQNHYRPSWKLHAKDGIYS